MTVVKYNNCEFSVQNKSEYRSTLSGVGEIITSIGRYLWQYEYGRGHVTIINLYSVIDDSVMLDLHNIYSLCHL